MTSTAKKQDAAPAEPAPVVPFPGDIAPTGPQGIGPIFNRQPSEREKEAAEVRRKYGPLVDAVANDPVQRMKREGSALFVAHMVVELGEAKASKMTAAEVHAYGKSFRHRFPGAWGAAARGNALEFTRQLQLAGQRELGDASKRAEVRAAISRDYQAMSSQLLGP